MDTKIKAIDVTKPWMRKVIQCHKIENTEKAGQRLMKDAKFDRVTRAEKRDGNKK
ncbi:hypothetical protein LCGC14_1209030 [marine sediment metagenome]|uniref:Uncharacterized protein n=1 Tax=marine sediment metagenome TaxID=412755 RepID=A0A0F9NWZ0_9ZZZZ